MMRPAVNTAAPRVAVACSGLGHIQRGIESWALDLAKALRRAGQPVDLFGGRPAPTAQPIGCFARGDVAAIRLARLFRRLGGWRYGAGSPYEIEQATFAFNLWRRIRSTHDILHVQDPLVATMLDRAYRFRLSRARVIYANGTGEPSSIMQRFAHLQLLTPQAAQDWKPQQPKGQTLHVVPNFIDTTLFRPGDRAAARAQLGLPPDGTILFCCAAIRRAHKRVDLLLRAFTAARKPGDGTLLLIAGAHEPDTDAIIAEGRQQLGDAVRFMVNVSRTDLPLLYQAADLLVVSSLFEMFGIVIIEAMACGLPILCHDTPDFRYVAGSAGLFRDLTDEASFTAALEDVMVNRTFAGAAPAARPQATSRFSETIVIRQIAEMYRTTMQATV